jgi:uncharacterized protein YbaP (TraB family)
MWNRKLLSAGLALLLCGQSFGAGAAALAASAEHLAPAGAAAGPLDTRRQGALYRVTRNGQVSYLFGTVHVGTKAFYPLAPAVARALAGSTRLVVELDTRANDAFQQAVHKHGSYGAGDDIGKHISADTLARLTEALHAVGITVASVDHLKPWLLANLLMGLELGRNGYLRSEGIESFLLANAQAHHTEVAELESADYQLSLFDTLNDADAERYLRESLGELADGTSLKKNKAVIDAWSSGDPAALDALIADATAGGTVQSEFTRRTLLGRRNPEMAARIERIMQDDKVTFVGVGLLHLLGANGLPQLLSQQGYQVERLY